VHVSEQIIRDLGEGLILRRSTKDDTERLAAFNEELHREPEAASPEEAVAAWTRDLMSGNHPTFDPGDFTLVEEPHTGALVSALCLISQTWSYGGIPFGVGRVELVGTHPDYRRRGLVRAQMEVAHDWSAERGEQVQSITGIPHFYRQFGYEMGLALGGVRAGYRPQVPKLKEGEEEPYRLRPAGEGDLPFIGEVYERSTERSLVACTWDEALWRYELRGKSPKNDMRRDLVLIEGEDGEPVGFVAHSRHLNQGRLSVWLYELRAGVSWLAVTPPVIRYLWARGEELAHHDPKQEMESFALWIGDGHPISEMYPLGLPLSRPPYAWYVRVADLPAFVRQIAPVLERRLAESPLVGHSGELKISLYRSGLRLGLEAGRLATVEAWAPTISDVGAAALPDLTFLQLLFGYRSLAELDGAFADCWLSSDAARALLNALFPKQASAVWPVS
jgi:GNAT superfamily N-acetyltransferase